MDYELLFSVNEERIMPSMCDKTSDKICIYMKLACQESILHFLSLNSLLSSVIVECKRVLGGF